MKRKLLKNLLISSSVLVLVSSVTLGLCLMPQKQNMITTDSIKSTNINHNNKQLSSTNNTNNISNYLNNNPNYFLHDGFYTQLSSNETNVTIGGITYLLNTITNTATVINIEDTTSDLIIPGMIQSNKQFYNVTAIGNGACFNKQLKSISLPNSILSIGADAFANNLLTKVNLPLYLNSLGNNAFSNNPFYEGTVINIPSKCTWNKNANLCPFNNDNNAGQFTRCVKYIIQNLAIYGYVYQSNAWQIVSWMPQVANLIPNDVVAKNNIFTTNQTISNPVTQKQTYNSFSIPTLSLNNVSLQNNTIAILSQGQYVQQLYGFNVSNNNLSFYWTNSSYQPGQNFVITISNPNTNTQIYSSLNSYSTNSIPIEYGDVVSIYFNEGQNNSNYRLLTGLPANQINNANLSSCGISQYFCCNYQSNNGGTNDFIITQNGFIPYQNVMHVNVNCLQENVKNFNLTGTALADHIVTATIDGKSYEALSNSDGEFSILITPSSPIALGTNVTVTCNGCLTYSSKLVGANPINSGFLFEDGADFGILPDGYTGTYKLWNSSTTTMPLFNNPTNSNNTSYSSSNSIVTKNNLNIILTDTYENSSNKTISSTVTINEKAGENCASNLNSELQTLTFNSLYTNTLTIEIPTNSQLDFYSAIYNSNSFEVQHSTSNNYNIYTFMISNNDLYCKNPNTYTNQPTYYSNNGFFPQWAVRNFMMVNYQFGTDGMYEDDYDKANFYDPTPLMWQTVRNITANCQSDYAKAVAINEWVYNNMTYTHAYSYGYTISQTFNHLEGVCGNYADLAAVMCMMAGMVSRIVIGNCSNATSYFSPSYVNHAWMQVWDEQIGAWVTLDPTWDWFFPYGDVQDQFNLCRSNMHICMVLWPPKTNYFSYFTNHMYDALLNYGRFFNFPGGNPGMYYPMQYAAKISQLLQSATTITGYDSNVIK